MYGLDKFVWKIVSRGGEALKPIILLAFVELIADNFKK